MAEKYIPFAITKPDATPNFITSSTMTTGNYYGEATGIGEQVWRYEAITGSSTLVLDNIPANEDVDTLIKLRIPHSVEGRAELRIIDTATNNGYLVFLDSGRILFGAHLSSNVVDQSSLTRIVILPSVDTPFWIRLSQSGTAATAKGWTTSQTEPATATTFGGGNFNTTASRQVWIRLTAPSTLDSIPAIYDLHYAGIGTAGDPTPTFPIGGLKFVTGTVRDPSGNPVTHPYPVRLCHKATGTVLARGNTDSNGRFSLSANIASDEPCYVLSVDTRQELWTSAIAGNV